MIIKYGFVNGIVVGIEHVSLPFDGWLVAFNFGCFRIALMKPMNLEGLLEDDKDE